MRILRDMANKKLKNLKSGDVFSWLGCMEDSNPNVYRLTDYKSAYCFNKNTMERLTDDDFDSLVYVYENPILDLRNQ